MNTKPKNNNSIWTGHSHTHTHTHNRRNVFHWWRSGGIECSRGAYNLQINSNSNQLNSRKLKSLTQHNQEEIKTKKHREFLPSLSLSLALFITKIKPISTQWKFISTLALSHKHSFSITIIFKIFLLIYLRFYVKSNVFSLSLSLSLFLSRF